MHLGASNVRIRMMVVINHGLVHCTIELDDCERKLRQSAKNLEAKQIELRISEVVCPNCG